MSIRHKWVDGGGGNVSSKLARSHRAQSELCRLRLAELADSPQPRWPAAAVAAGPGDFLAAARGTGQLGLPVQASVLGDWVCLSSCGRMKSCSW